MTIKTLTQAASALRPLLLMGLLLALPGQVMARDFTCQGVVYTVLDDEAKTCGTRAGSADNPGNDFMDDVLDIPATVSDGTDTYTVTQIGAYSFADNYFIESLIIPSTVRTIGDYAFNGNTVLETIDMAEGLETIGWYAFADCPQIRSFRIPNSVTYVGKQVCANCRNLVDLTIGNSVERIGDEAFMNCVKIESVDIPASMISSGYRTFTGCSALRTVVVHPVAEDADITGFEELVNMGYSTLDRIICPDYITYHFLGAFIEELWTTFYPLGTRVENGLFLTDDTLYAIAHSPENGVIEVPDGVKYIGEKCAQQLSGIMVLKIPESVIEIGAKAFWRTSLNTVEFGTDSKLEILKEEAFCDSKLLSFKAPSSLHRIEDFALWCPLKELDLGNVTYIGENAIDYKGENLIIPNTLTYIGCSNFSSYVGDSLLLPESVQTIGWNSFEKIKYVVAPPTLKEIILDGQFADSDPSTLLNRRNELMIDLRNCRLVVPEGVSYISNRTEPESFRKCVNVIHYPAKGTVIENGWVWSVNRKILYSAPVVTGEKLIIPGTAQTIGEYACANCEAKEIVIEEGVINIQKDAFTGANFSKIKLPSTLKTLEEGAFSEKQFPSATYVKRAQVDRLVIPGGVTSIPDLYITFCDTLVLENGIQDIDCQNYMRHNSPVYTEIPGQNPPSINLRDLHISAFNPSIYIGGSDWLKPKLIVPPTMMDYYRNDAAWSKFDIQPKVSFNFPDTIYAETAGKHSLGLSSLYPLSDYPDQLEITLTSIEGKISIYDPVELQQYIERNGDEFFIYVNRKMWDYYTPSSPCEFTYTLELKMGDFYSETKKVIVKLTPSKADAKGDSNLDGAVTVTDAINTANYAVGNQVEIFSITAADMNEDGLITIGDASRIITAILNQPLESLQPLLAARIRARQSGDCLSINDFSLQAGQTGAIEVALKNSCDYVALQADVYAPAGMTIVGVEKGKRSQASHSLMHSACNAAAVRVALVNFSNNSFATSDDAVLRLIVKADDDYTPGTLTIANIIASDATAKEYYLPSAVSHDDGLSGVGNIAGEEAQARIAVEGHELVVSNAAGKTVRVYSTAGVGVAKFTAASDCERQPLDPGFYIVAVGNAVEKVIIK